ncbi:MAG: cadherin-like domain-containing protein, partial [Actinobacteria bacterium]|nr:cadherin-like domain-containing protein [Actinomycetota bacterium]
TVSINVPVGASHPPNDDFAAAQAISGPSGAVTGSNAGATTEEGEPVPPWGFNGGPTIWYAWTAPYDGQVTFDTCTTQFWSLLSVYKGESIGTTTPVAAGQYADEVCGSASNVMGRRVAFDVTAGAVYRIRVDGANECGQTCYPQTGTMTLRWTAVEIPGPANDDFADAQAISGTSGSVTGTNVRATEEPGEPDHGFAGAGAASVWYRWTAPADGSFAFETCQSQNDAQGRPLDTILAVYTGETLDALSLTTFSDGTETCPNGYWERVVFAATAGTVYHVAVDGYPGYDTNGDGSWTDPDTGRVVLDWRVLDGTSPVAGDDTYSALERTPLVVPTPGVLANDTDPNGDTLAAGSPSDPAGGSVTVGPDGSFTYTSDAGFSGLDTFTYTVSDGNGGSDTGRVFIDVAPTSPVGATPSRTR